MATPAEGLLVSNLTFIEKMKFEKLFGMSSGYVLDFSNRTLQEFVAESIGLNIYDQKYVTGHSASKANCLRSLWRAEPNNVVGKLLRDLVEYYRQIGHDPAIDPIADDCSAIAMKLIGDPIMAKNEPLVFISYARPDLHVTHALAALLESAGLRTWFDKKDLQGGQDWESVIRQGIAEASLVLICLSTRSVDRKGYFHKEMRYAVNEAMKLPKGKVYIVPVRLDSCEIPEDLRPWHTLDLFDLSGSHALLKSIGSALGSAVRASSEAHDALAQASKPFYPFVLEDGEKFKLGSKILGADRCMYDVEISETILGFDAAKIRLRVRRYVVGQPAEMTYDDTRGLSSGESMAVADPWQLLLDKVEEQKAYFIIRHSAPTVRRTF